MATTKTAARKSVPLTQHELDVVQRIRETGTPEATAFHTLTGVNPNGASESSVVSSILHLGCVALAEKETELSIERAAIADAQDPERKDWRRAMRGRHLRPFMGEQAASA